MTFLMFLLLLLLVFLFILDNCCSSFWFFCSSSIVVVTPLDPFVHPQQFLLFLLILMFIFINCCYFAWSFCSSSIVVTFLDHFVHFQHLLLLILYSFSTQPPITISLSITPPPPHSFNFCLCLKLLQACCNFLFHLHLNHGSLFVMFSHLYCWTKVHTHISKKVSSHTFFEITMKYVSCFSNFSTKFSYTWLMIVRILDIFT